MRQFHLAYLLFTFLFVCYSAPARLQADDGSVGGAGTEYFDITASEARKIVVAVPGFTGSAAGAGGAGLTAARLVTRGFELYSFLDIIDYGSYGGRRDADWSALGADYVVLGEVNRDAAGLAVTGQILEVATGRTLPGRSYRGGAGLLEDMSLKLCDALIGDFTGEPGVAHTRMAYVSDATGRKEVHLSDILGRHPRQVTRHKALTVSPRLSPDGNILAYTSYHRGNQDLYLTDLRQNAQTTSISRRPGMNLAPAFTPDGNMVVTLSMGGNPDLYLIDRRGGIIRQLTERAGINVSPSISPDGRSIAFSSDRSRGGHPKVYVMDLASRQVRVLQHRVGECSEPAWSPKGDEIAFTGLVGGRYQIFVCDVNGGNVRQVSGGGGDFESPTWAPDGRLLAATRKSGGRSQICVLDKNGKSGKNARVLLNMRGNLTFPQWSPRLP